MRPDALGLGRSRPARPARRSADAPGAHRSQRPARLPPAPRRLQLQRMQDMGDDVWEGSGVVQLEPMKLDEVPSDSK